MFRLPAPWGSRIDRDRAVTIRFDGQPVTGFLGDTVASAVLADPAQPDYLARSFKYHRPRSLGLGRGLDANQYMTVNGQPNQPADRRPIADKLIAEPQNVFGSLRRDLGAAMGAFSRFLPPGFYYDAFFKPHGSWPFWEKIIRRFAGLGVLDASDTSILPSEKSNLFCDVAVVGGGLSGLSAALAAAEAGRDVILLERDPWLGGMAHNAYLSADERARLESLVAAVTAHARITVLLETTCAGWFQGDVLTAHAANLYHHIHAPQVVVAAGAVEQPLVFRNNDLPGILFASTCSLLMRAYGVCPGQQVLVQTANRFGYEAALTLAEAGCEVLAVLEMRDAAPDDDLVRACRARGIAIIPATTVVEALRGRDGRIAGAVSRRIAGDGVAAGPARRWACDTLVTSVAFTPLMQLVCHSGGEVVYDEALATLRVARTPANAVICGALNGRFGTSVAADDGARAGRAAAARFVGEPIDEPEVGTAEPVNARRTIFPHPKGKEFVDFDEDQTVGDIRAAVAAGFGHMELMKRFTTTGMGPSQGRTTALNAVKVFAEATGQDLSTVRITTQRPPFEPEPFANLAAGVETPMRRTVLHRWHLDHGAVMMPAGDWRRPAYYGDVARRDDAVEREVHAVRHAAGLVDASTHGGFHLAGPDAIALLNLAYVNDFGDFPVGAARTAMMVDELGAVADDGFAARLSDAEIYMATSSGASAATNRRLRRLIAERGLKVTISELSGAIAILNLAGPKARDILRALPGDIDLSPEAFPFHSFRRGVIAGVPATVIRGDFVGEVTFELHVGAAYAVELWERLMEAGRPFGLRPFGVLAQRVLRLEKAYAILGQDTDQETTLDDIGRGDQVAIHKPYFVGKSAIQMRRTRPVAQTLVPISLSGGRADTPGEYSLIEKNGKVIGRITSAEYSPTFGEIVGLALLDSGAAQPGETVRVWRQNGVGAEVRLLAQAPYDPLNERQKI